MAQPAAMISWLAILTVLAATLRGQVTVRAITRTGLQASAGPPMSVPPDTDITNGISVTSSGSSAFGFASASTVFSLARTERAIDVVLDERGTASWNQQTTIAYPAATVGYLLQQPPEHGIDVELSSTVPMSVRITVTTCNDWGSTYGGTLAIPGHGVVRNALFQTPMCHAPASQAFNVTLGAAPTVLAFSTHGHCQSSRVTPNVTFRGRWSVTIANLPSCDGVAYETPCGASLASFATLTLPGTWVELVDAAQPTAALLLIGTQRLRAPFGGCFLYTDLPITLPFGLTAQNRASVYLAPLPFPVRVTTQGLTIGPAGFHASNGLELSCR